MYNNHVHHGYRVLTIEERRKAEQAIDWLAQKRLRAHEIALLTDRNLDREGKALEVVLERGRLIFYRRIRYAGSAFDLYLTEVLPCLKVEKWLFPNLCWTGRKPSFGFHVHTEDVENYLAKRKKRLLIYQKQNANIEASARKSNIKTQITVGRRIALRA